MASSAFKSTSRRGAATEPKAPPPPTAASRRRSHSVSAVSRKTHVPFNDGDKFISTEFSNSRDNPLFWATSSSSPPESEKLSKIDNTKSSSRSGNSRSSNSVSEQRGRSFTRSSSNNNGIGRSLSRVRGRSVSRGAYESEKDLGMATSTSAQSKNERTKVVNGINRNDSVRNRVDRRVPAENAGVTKVQNEASEWSEDDSACSFQISNLDDGVSMDSFSEAEEKTIRAVCEDLNGFQINKINTVTATSIADMPSNLVNPDALGLISDIRREYAIKLEESEERARKLRADLAVEEHRGQELNKILKEILPSPNTCGIQRSHRGRRTSNERKRMSKRLTEEAMTYFDECVSLSTFDSSDFSASEDPPYTSLGPVIPIGASSLVKESCYDQGSDLHQKQVQQQQLHSSVDSGITVNSSNANAGIIQQYQFSFADKKPENVGQTDEDIRSYIKHFERDIISNKEEDVESEEKCKRSSSSLSYYDSIHGHIESVLMDMVLYKNRIESGGLLLCGGAIM
ncbi:hypothetical protein BUALT_Bualt01G0148500 [Buddleja alternifolia]|uniref:Uncharacterized protein n=1 Tax=Buddleja alternifolia TaxID=168488 RepID=A0AAV6Y886_9LAMI|nr:hypothetical protein BUALT_Bualt01G0148500 [Buddleja alternifolia]